MRNISLYEAEPHRLILLDESEFIEKDGVRSNQYLVIRNEADVLLDRGGFGIMPSVRAEMLRHLNPDRTYLYPNAYSQDD